MPPTVPFIYYRGGTSKAVIFHATDLPPPGRHRDTLILRLMGSPDRMQIDGMGGTHPVTSKVAIISPSTRPDCEVDYLFAQVSINSPHISYDGGCGNISSAVGPFAINEGLIHVSKGTETREVSIWMVGTGTKLIAHVPMHPDTGRAREKGDYRIDGCPGTGAPILMDYRHTAGGALKRGLLPTSTPTTTLTVQSRPIPATICDIAHIIVFGHARDFSITGAEPAAALNSSKDLIDRVREFRGRAAELIGLCSDWRKVDEEAPNLPYVVLVSATGEDEDEDVQARLFLDNHCHTSMAGTGAACTAACSRIPGTLVNEVVKKAEGRSTFKIKHPLGHILVEVETESEEGGEVRFATLSFVRTARCIAKGELFVPEDFEGEGQLVNGNHV